MSFDRYRRVLGTRGVGLLLLASLGARLSYGMTGFAVILLLTRGHLSYAGAGVVTAVYLIASGIMSPIAGRAIDTWGRRRVLVPMASAYFIVLSTFAFAASSPKPVLLGLAALAGASAPPVAAATRSLWPQIAEDELLESIYALEATFQELVFIVGPALVTVITAASRPEWAVVASGLATLLGVLGMAAHPATAGRGRGRGVERHRNSRPFRIPGVARIMAAAALTIIAFNVVDISVISFISGAHATSASGVALAIWSFGSFVGGLVYGARAASQPIQLRLMYLATAVTLGLLALAPNKVGLCLLLVVCGFTIAPALARTFGVLGRIVPPSAANEAFGWLGTCFVLGSSVGSAVGGLVVTHAGSRWGFGLAGAFAMTGVAVLWSLVLPDPESPVDEPASTALAAA